MDANYQQPEGALIDAALKRQKLSARQAAKRAKLSDARWRQIVNGYASAGAGQVVRVVGPAETIARMAEVVSVTPDELRNANRPDAAAELERLAASRQPLGAVKGADAVEHLRGQLNPGLAAYTDYDITHETEIRLLFMAAKLEARGESVLRRGVNAEGEDIITSGPPVGEQPNPVA